MPGSDNIRQTVPIGALCDLDRRTFPVAISEITPGGCSCEAEFDWDCDHEFLHLRIAGKVDINGRVLWRDGNRAGIAFYGQIHPLVIAEWVRFAA